MSEIRLQNHTTDLMKRLNNQRLKRDVYCDVQIYSIDGSSFKAHSSVLAACTPQLKEQLEIQLRNGSHQLELFLLADSDSVASLLDAIYSGQVTISQSTDISNLSNLAFVTGFSELTCELEHTNSQHSQNKPHENLDGNGVRNIVKVESLSESNLKLPAGVIGGHFESIHTSSASSSDQQKDSPREATIFENSDINEVCPSQSSILPHISSESIFDTSSSSVDVDVDFGREDARTNRDKSRLKLEEHKCKYCGKSFALKTYLKLHSLKVHNMVEDVPAWKCQRAGESITKTRHSTRRRSLLVKIATTTKNKRKRGRITRIDKNDLDHDDGQINRSSYIKEENFETGYGEMEESESTEEVTEESTGEVINTADIENHCLEPKKKVQHKCTTCNKNFGSKAWLRRHNVTVHNMEEDIPTWKCPSPKCGRTLVEKSAYEDHLMRHGLKEKLKCKVCNSEFISSKAYRNHIFTKACQHDGQLIQRKGRITWKRAAGIKNSTMTKGKRGRPWPKVKEDNLELTENNGGTNDGSLVFKGPRQPRKKAEKGSCDICGKTLITKKLLIKHYTNIHKMPYTGKIDDGERKEVCEICGDFFSHKTGLKMHQIRVHKFTHLLKKGKRYFCKTCDTLCLSRNEYENHLRRHGMLPKLVCHMCARPFAQKTEFQRHTKNKLCQPDANIAKRPVCDVCFHEFSTSSSLKRHQIAIHGYSHLSKYFCDVCHSPCSDSRDYKNHKVKHGISEKYSCDVCNKKYADYRTMTKHRAKHPEWKGRNYKGSQKT